MKVCPVCKSNKVVSYIKVNNWVISKCGNCGVLHTETTDKGAADRQKFYRNEYVSAYILRENLLKSRFKKYLSRIERYKKGGNLLDLGCGIGYFIDVAAKSENYFWKTTGLELNKGLISRSGPEVHDRIIQGTISNLPFSANTFNCITCFDVLEHDINIMKNLLEIRKTLKNDGIVVIQMPNYKSLMAYLTREKWDWWAPPDHVLHVSFNILISILIDNGFEILESFTYESTNDFLENIRGRFRYNTLTKILYIIISPLLVLLERIGWLFNYGALSFVIAKKHLS